MVDIKHKVYLRPIEATLPEPDAAPYRCIQLNEDWISLVLGLLSFMQWRFMWEGTEEQKDIAAQQFEKFMGIMNGECSVITDIRIEGTELQKQVCGSSTWETVGELPTPEPVEPEMRVFDGFIQWKASNESTWHDLIALEDLRGADGQNAPIPEFAWDGYQLKIDADADGTFDVTSPSLRGATGTGEPGEAGQNAPIPAFRFVTSGGQVAMQIDADANGSWDYTSPNLKGGDGESGCFCVDVPSEPEDPRTNDHICAGVNGTVDWLISRYNTYLDEQEAIVNGVKTIADGVLAMVTLGAGEITPIDNFIAFAHALTLSMVESERDQLADSTFQENITCSLYCLLKDSPNGGLTEEIYTAWLDTIPDYPFPLPGHWGLDIERLFLFTAIQRRYNLYSLNTDATCEGLCLDCATEYWCGTMNIDIDGQSSDVHNLPGATDPTKTYRITATGTFKFGNGESDIRDFAYSYVGNVWLAYVLCFNTVEAITPPSFNYLHEYSIDVQGDGNVWQFGTGDLGSESDNTTGDMHVIIECLG